MSQLHCKIPNISLCKPNGLSSTLFFSVYNGANAIAFAQLSSRTGRSRHKTLARQDAVIEDRPPGVSYCLRIIEVSQNYRNRGIGSALLDEVINFCKDERVSHIYGEAKGETSLLRQWYRAKGFDLDSTDNIQMSLS